MKKLLSWSAIIIFTVILIVIIFGKKDNDQTSSKNETAKYVMDEKEKAVYDALLNDDLASFSRGDESMLADSLGIIASTSTEVAKAYDENQVAADQKFYKKEILISGKIQAINSGLGNEPYVVMSGSNQFLQPQIHFDKPDLQKISNLSKGQLAAFVCKGNGAIAGTPLFKNCALAEDYGLDKVQKKKIALQDFLNGEKSTDQFISGILFISIAAAKKLPATSDCYKDGKNCIKEIKNAVKKINEADAKNIRNELQKAGLKI